MSEEKQLLRKILLETKKTLDLFQKIGKNLKELGFKEKDIEEFLNQLSEQIDNILADNIKSIIEENTIYE